MDNRDNKGKSNMGSRDYMGGMGYKDSMENRGNMDKRDYMADNTTTAAEEHTFFPAVA